MRFALLPGAASYDVRTDATVEMTAGPAGERGRETVASAARVDYVLATASRTVTFNGQVAGLAVQSSQRIAGATPPQPAPTPVRFRGVADARTARVDADSPVLGCLSTEGAAQQAALAAARETVVPVPASLTVAARWRDSTTTLTCRGPVPATVTTVASYQVIAIDGTRVRLRRDVTTTVRGGGIAGGRSVTVSGAGVGSATIELDATVGRLTRLDGDVRTTITVTLPDGARQFVQQAATHVQARDGR